MATLLGQPVSSVSQHLLYPEKPGLKAWMETPNPDGYTEQMGQFGTRPGTILPHHSARTPIEQLRKQKAEVRTNVVTILEPTADNPMGGMQVLIPSFDMQKMTPEKMAQAREAAKSMTQNPIEQDVLMFRILADEAKGVSAADTEQVPAAAVTASSLVPAASPLPPPIQQPVPAGVVGMTPGQPLTPEQIAQAIPYLLQLQQLQQQAPVSPAPVSPPAAAPRPPQVFLGAPQQAGPSVPTSSKLFECLGIPDLDMQPGKPRCQVNFTMGKFGGQSAFYHWVMREPNAIYLVFDTRYDYPMYSPPNLGPDEPLEIELVNVQGGSSKISCCSCGMTFTFGVFRIFILLDPAGA